MRKNRYGWIPDLPDKRDYLYIPEILKVIKLPPSVDLSTSCPPIYDQKSIGSCTAQSSAAMDQFVSMKQKLPTATVVPSRLQIYYDTRVLEGTPAEDAGGTNRDAIKVIAKIGAASEKLWPYTISKFAVKPTKAVYADAAKHKAITYLRINRVLNDMKTCLAAGFPFIIGISVYDSFESDKVAKTGIVPMPNIKKESLLGGHSIGCVGYSDSKKAFLLRNSWGISWGLKGYFWLPYAYLTDTNLSDDFWTIRTMS